MIFVPTSPALVPALGTGDDSSADLLRSARALVDDILTRHQVTEINLVGSREPRNYTAHTGSFRAWGAPEVTVGAGNYLAELVQRFVLIECTLPITVGEIRKDPTVLNMVGIDGPAGLSNRAPLSLIPTASQRHAWCMDLLSGERVSWPKNRDGLAADGIVEPEMWWMLRSLRPAGGQLAMVSDAHGVGRYVASWEGVS